MRTLKPFGLSVLPRAIDTGTGTGFELALSVFAAFDMHGPAPRLLLEQTLWGYLPKAAPGFVESGVPKSRSEYLVFGHAYAHGPQGAGVPVPRSRVGVRFGALQKALLVWGRRQWDGRTTGEPEPFVRMPLDWSLGFGGAGFADNPAGRGFVAPRADEGDAALPAVLPAPIELPIFEDPAHPWQPRPEGNVCAGFSPIALDSPRRTRFQGTPDAQWLETRFPGPPADFDPRYHQLAPEDQQSDTPWAGDEAYELHRLHPVQPRLAGQLPGIAPRAFVKRREGGALVALPTALRSVLFFPADERIVLIWQGQMAVQDAEFSELSHLLVGAEALAAPRPISHYARVLEERDHADTGGLAALRDGDLLPPGLDFEPQVTLEGLEDAPHSFGQRARARRHRELQALDAKLKAAGHAEGIGAERVAEPVLPRTPEELPGFIARIQAEGERRAAQGQREIDAQREAAAGRAQARAQAEAAAGLAPRAEPQPLGVVAQLAQARERIDRAAPVSDLGPPPTGLPAMGAVPPPARGAEHEAKGLAAYRQAAHLMKPASRAEQRFRDRQREGVQQRLKAGQGLAGLDLTGADLRDVDFSGRNLDDAMLESALLDGARCDGATFRRAVLAHASLRGAALADADFSRANLGRAGLQGAQAPRALFDAAECFEADFSGAQLPGASFKEAQLKGVRLAQANLQAAKLDETVLLQADLTGADLGGASAFKTLFIETLLTGASLRGLSARRAVFYKVDASGLHWDGATLEGATFAEGMTLARARLVQADLRRCVLRQIDLSRCDLRHAQLDGALLMRAVLKRSRMGGASAIGAQLGHAVLDRADMRYMNLRDANLAGASARASDLRHANLFGADLSRLETDDATAWDDTLSARVRWYPKARPAAVGTG
jgi:uncharacterized protein YjbI with pentapeptide repeats